MSAVEKKVCTKCGGEKSIDEFGERKNALDGHYAICKTCISTSFSKAGKASARKRRQQKKVDEKRRRNHRPARAMVPRQGDVGHHQWAASKRSQMAKEADRMNQVLDSMNEVLPLQASLVAAGFGTFVRQLRASGVVLVGVEMVSDKRMKITYQRTEEVSL